MTKNLVNSESTDYYEDDNLPMIDFYDDGGDLDEWLALMYQSSWFQEWMNNPEDSVYDNYYKEDK